MTVTFIQWNCRVNANGFVQDQMNQTGGSMENGVINPPPCSVLWITRCIGCFVWCSISFSHVRVCLIVCSTFSAEHTHTHDMPSIYIDRCVSSEYHKHNSRVFEYHKKRFTQQENLSTCARWCADETNNERWIWIYKSSINRVSHTKKNTHTC